VKYYKVVRKFGDIYQSSCYGSTVTYEIGKTTLPIYPNSKLFVFDDLENAKRFIKDQYNIYDIKEGYISLFEADITNPINIPYMSRIPDSDYQFWGIFSKINNDSKELKNFRLFNYYVADAPKGTIGVDTVILKNKVDIGNSIWIRNKNC
jgi:hypothetical protein